MARWAALISIGLMLVVGGIVLLTRREDDTALVWFTQNVCELPCWRGITPGQTRYLDAVRILRDQTDIKIDNDDTPSGYPYVAVTFRLKTDQGQLHGELVSDENASRVQHIYISPVTESGMPAFSIATLISVLGPPDALMPDSSVGGLIRMGYPERHFEMLNLQWSLYLSDSSCNRFEASTGLYLGDDPNFQPWEVWQGFNRKFDEWCHESR